MAGFEVTTEDSIYEPSATPPPGFPIQHTHPGTLLW
jgi:hypothetical protein